MRAFADMLSNFVTPSASLALGPETDDVPEDPIRKVGAWSGSVIQLTLPNDEQDAKVQFHATYIPWSPCKGGFNLPYVVMSLRYRACWGIFDSTSKNSG